jgi:hypothetical protein
MAHVEYREGVPPVRDVLSHQAENGGLWWTIPPKADRPSLVELSVNGDGGVDWRNDPTRDWSGTDYWLPSVKCRPAYSDNARYGTPCPWPRWVPDGFTLPQDSRFSPMCKGEGPSMCRKSRACLRHKTCMYFGPPNK